MISLEGLRSDVSFVEKLRSCRMKDFLSYGNSFSWSGKNKQSVDTMQTGQMYGEYGVVGALS